MIKKITTLTELEEIFSNVPPEATYLELYVYRPNLPELEIVKNPVSNMCKKMEFVKMEYNDDLTMKTCDKTKLVGVDFCYNMFKTIKI